MSSGLLLIDIQNDYFPGGRMELSGAHTAAENAKILLQTAREKGTPVIHVQHLSARPGADFFLPGTTGAGIHPMVFPLPGENIIIKHYPNSFRGTNLQEVLSGFGIDHLLICGMMTHMCVDATVRAATDLGYRCSLAADGCATRDLTWDKKTVPACDVHRAFLAALSGLYAEVLPAGSMLRELSTNR